MSEAPATQASARSAPSLSSPQPFGARLATAMSEKGPLCAGIDPHPALLRAWGLGDDVRGLERFARSAVEAFAGQVAAVKPQAAFFERHGSAGVAVLERVVAELSHASTLCIVDAKRGDVGSTMAAYADAYAGDSPLAGDAVTATAYLGWGSLTPLLERAAATGRGVFVLALTSNPEGVGVQHAVDPATRRSVAAGITEAAAAWNAERAADAPAGGMGSVGMGSVGMGSVGMGSVGLVVGATVGDAVSRLGLDLAAVNGPLLAPGFGAQGAGAADLVRVFGAARGAVLVASSRELLVAGPAVAAVRDAARVSADACRAALT